MIPLENALASSHRLMRTYVPEGGVAIDATLGNGNDALFLSGLLGKNGTLYGFDVQPEALERARQKLDDNGCRAVLLCAGHQHMKEYVKERADYICFNLGFLPAGDKRLTTHVDTTLSAVSQALELLKPGGVCSVCVYPGHDEGMREKRALIDMLSKLDCREFTVVHRAFLNPNGDPPQLFAVQKNG